MSEDSAGLPKCEHCGDEMEPDEFGELPRWCSNRCYDKAHDIPSDGEMFQRLSKLLKEKQTLTNYEPQTETTVAERDLEELARRRRKDRRTNYIGVVAFAWAAILIAHLPGGVGWAAVMMVGVTLQVYSLASTEKR